MKGDPPAIGRPARKIVNSVKISELDRLAAICVGNPHLVLAGSRRNEHDPFPVRRKVGKPIQFCRRNEMPLGRVTIGLPNVAVLEPPRINQPVLMTGDGRVGCVIERQRMLGACVKNWESRKPGSEDPNDRVLPVGRPAQSAP